MSVNESGLNRTTQKDTQLQTKLINLRKKEMLLLKKLKELVIKIKLLRERFED